ncbi:unnamed protein product [Mycena citricolor]|uniref:Peroxisomal biogenesis factor 11 n=1 Tax=Mycena citricolor TaxID=2018698 RepID=A0AAD2GVR4_9AGAR|nr:unnamed protein product [Mycena citricolor]
MSHMSFPGEDASGSFYMPFESQASSSAFQMNPLSLHPPRTPRTSLSSAHPQSHGNGFSGYEGSSAKEESNTIAEVDEEEDLEEDSARLKLAQTRVSNEEVWREMFLTSNGRDKAFVRIRRCSGALKSNWARNQKLIQYGLKLYLLFHNSVASTQLLHRSKPPAWEQELRSRLSSTVDGLSRTRKCLLLFNWLAPLTAILARRTESMSMGGASKPKAPTPFLHTLMHAPPPVLLDLVHSSSDDVYTFSLLGLLSKKTGERAARFSDWCWLLATLVGLVENGVERQMIGGLQHEVHSRLYAESMANPGKSKPLSSATAKQDEKEMARLQKQDFWLQITRTKLLMDLIFVSYDVFRLQRWRDTVKTCAGLTSGMLSAWKLYDRHQQTLLKAATTLAA